MQSAADYVGTIKALLIEITKKILPANHILI
ncbi:hypothetical protein Megvenef_00629 [Candidatus Megaera venefica]|uniref:Uncharacterized protein n=1 Tax=Candidatus Megaera venefica TaxID=2055910 RepID=A0ABU5NC03_9RICK|nr:hypothetical protein [Candidatus Megaera venefica]